MSITFVTNILDFYNIQFIEKQERVYAFSQNILRHNSGRCTFQLATFTSMNRFKKTGETYIFKKSRG